MKTIDINNYHRLKSEISYKNVKGVRTSLQPFNVEFICNNQICSILVPANFSWKPSGPKIFFENNSIDLDRLEFAVLLHDILYKNRGNGVFVRFAKKHIKITRATADLLFFENSVRAKIGKKKALKMWMWVYLFGWFWWVT